MTEDSRNSGTSDEGDSDGVLGTIRDFINRSILHSDTSNFQKNMFRVYIREVSIQRARGLLYGISLLVALFWPIDFMIIEDTAGLWNFSLWRGLTIILLAGGITLFDFIPALRSNFNTYLLTGLTIYLPLTGYLFGSVYGPDFPWFYLTFLIPLFIVVFAFDFFQRLFACTFLTSCFLFSYLLARPDPFGFRYIEHIFTLSTSAMVLGVIIGHAIHHLDYVNYFQQRMVSVSHQKIQHMAEHDQLTGLLNRRQFDTEADQEFERCERYNRRFSLLMIDLDHFKEINDTYGHPTGDDVLKRMGSIIKENSRRIDITGRYGGEEFCIALPETPLESAEIFANRLREELSEQSFKGPDGEVFAVTCSIGATEYRGEVENLRELLKRADEALYEAKENGRNRVLKT